MLLDRKDRKAQLDLKAQVLLVILARKAHKGVQDLQVILALKALQVQQALKELPAHKAQPVQQAHLRPALPVQPALRVQQALPVLLDRKSTRLNSSH